MNILAFDVSSTCIGYCLLDTNANTVLLSDIWLLEGTLAYRCWEAHRQARRLIPIVEGRMIRIDQIVVEEPVIVNVKTATMQIRVSGALYAACSPYGLLVRDIAPKAAKKRLAGSGNADKPAMIMAAAPYLSPGITPVVQRHKGRFYAYVNGQRAYSEDQADALGLALVAADVLDAQQVAA